MNRLAAVLVVGLVVGCGSQTPQSVTLDGLAQKGPLVQGSSVVISGLDNGLNSTGSAFSTQTADNLGSFTAVIATATPALDLHASGYYMDEVSGAISSGPVDLHGVVSTFASHPKVNLLTTLQAPVLRTNVAGGMTLGDAGTASAAQVLSALGVNLASVQGFASFSSMQINGTGDQDAVLLAISAVLSQAAHNRAAQNGSSPAGELAFLINRFASDVQAGTLATDTAFQSAWRGGSAGLDLAAVRANVQGYYANVGVAVTPPAFEDWVDKDGSGVLPRRTEVVPSPISFTDVLDAGYGQTYTATATVSGLDAGVAAFVAFESDASTSAVSLSFGLSKNGTPVQTNQFMPIYSSAQNGDTLTATVTASQSGTTQHAVLQVGASQFPWTIQTP